MQFTTEQLNALLAAIDVLQGLIKSSTGGSEWSHAIRDLLHLVYYLPNSERRTAMFDVFEQSAAQCAMATGQITLAYRSKYVEQLFDIILSAAANDAEIRRHEDDFVLAELIRDMHAEDLAENLAAVKLSRDIHAENNFLTEEFIRSLRAEDLAENIAAAELSRDIHAETNFLTDEFIRSLHAEHPAADE